MKIAEKREVPGLAVLYLGGLGGDASRFVEFVDTVEPGVPKSEKWVMMLSTQIGCPVGCRMCDAGILGYEGNLSAEEMLAQFRFIIGQNPGLDPSRHPKLKVHFARMGEPSLNREVLAALRLLAREMPHAGILPSVSTVAPKSPATQPFFEELPALKEELFPRGRFQLQFSLHSLDDEARRRIVPIKQWTLEEISRYGDRFVRPEDRKITLNFALAAAETLDADRLGRTFDPGKFLIKITPVNTTLSSEANGATYLWSEMPQATAVCVEDLRRRGFEVIPSPSLPEELSAETSCGQLWSKALKFRAALAIRNEGLESESYVTAATLATKTVKWEAELARVRRRDLRLNAARAGLLVVDMQEFFLSRRSPAYLPQARAVLANAARLADAFRRAGRPVFFTRHAHVDVRRDGGLMASWWRKVCMEGTPESRVSRALDPQDGATFRKCRYSAFTNASLEPALRSEGLEDLVVAGVLTNLCVESTVRDAFDLGFRPFVAADATAAHSEEIHLASLKSMAQGFAAARLTDEILEELARFRRSRAVSAGDRELAGEPCPK